MPDRHLEALLSARLFLEPQLVDGRLFFLSNLGGHLSLYAMDAAGSVPEQLLPPTIAMQNPDLVDGESFVVMPGLDRILVALDRDGDERYRPYLIPISGGFPEPLAPDTFAGMRSVPSPGSTRSPGSATWWRSRSTSPGGPCTGSMSPRGPARWSATAPGSPSRSPGHPTTAGSSPWSPTAWATPCSSSSAARALGRCGEPASTSGAPMRIIPLSGFADAALSPSGSALLLVTALFDDAYSVGYLPLDAPGDVEDVEVDGAVHTGHGELDLLKRLGEGDRYLVGYNIDGCSWVYHGTFRRGASPGHPRPRPVRRRGPRQRGAPRDPLRRGVGGFAASYCTATDPTQLYLIDADPAIAPRRVTNERPLGLDPDLLSPGVDASFVSHDGLRVSARLYLPSERLGHTGPRPVVLYIHGGPQSQERPNFAWFSMPLIQYLTLRGFAVFVPNARGSTGYGLGYAKRVDGDWGGLDRLDHVWAMTEVLPADARVDTDRAAVVGRSYGGYMALMLAGRHPELWAAACDMFGPYDLFTFLDRIPETWKPYFSLSVGDPDRDRDLLVDRSPATHLDGLACPLLVIQGAQRSPGGRGRIRRPGGPAACRRQGSGVPRLPRRGPRRPQARQPGAVLRRHRRLLHRAPQALTEHPAALVTPRPG